MSLAGFYLDLLDAKELKSLKELRENNSGVSL
jgi:hypothetical protein